jgi:hypothetical protein
MKWLSLGLLRDQFRFGFETKTKNAPNPWKEITVSLASKNVFESLEWCGYGIILFGKFPFRDYDLSKFTIAPWFQSGMYEPFRKVVDVYSNP